MISKNLFVRSGLELFHFLQQYKTCGMSADLDSMAFQGEIVIVTSCLAKKIST